METKLNANAQKVLERRYLTKDENGKTIEDIPGMFTRVAKHIASADALFCPEADTAALEKEFYELMTSLRFVPNSPTLMNAGKPLGQLSACFVLPVGDSMEEIFDSVKNAALIHKSGGGTGFSFSRLRPTGATVRSTGGVASGPISFMKVFNSATEAVKQGGTRRGANMGILRIDHPDILSFIDCKKDNADITNFNISVGLTEAFMEAARKGGEYDLVDPHSKKKVASLNAKEVFDKIIDAAWRNGEPGIVFLDRLNRDNPTPQLGEIESTNPCGEQPLLPYESCNLGSINLVAMYREEAGKGCVDYELLGKTVDSAVHFLDNVIEVNKYPLEEISNRTRETRKIGLGVMGWADLLFRLGIAYGSRESLKLAEEVMGFIQQRSHAASEKLAAQRGTFPAYEGSVYSAQGLKMRNATTTTIAPTGTISIIAGVSSGIEPLFAISFVRNVMDNDELPEVNPYFEQIAKERGFYSAGLMRRIAKEGTLAHIDQVPEDVRRVFVTAHDITPQAHIDMQAVFQKYTDNAVSKTVNFTNSATREDVRKVYVSAYEQGCKGVTIYRDGSRQEQVLNIGEVNRKDAPAAAHTIMPRPRPAVTTGITEKVQIGCGNLYVTVNYDEQGICEVFANLGRAGGCPSQSEATSRLISIALRSGMAVEEIVEQLKGIRCHSTLRQMNQKGIKVLSCPDAIARVISKVAKEHDFTRTKADKPVTAEKEVLEQEVMRAACSEAPQLNGNCPECGATMEHEGGCVICRACGYSKCG
jgi:ribonucleoside-diphosphate reductase alpha chain